MKLKLTIILFYLGTVSVAFGDSWLDKGVEAYQEKNYQQAVNDFKKSANSGNPQGQNDLGVYYIRSVPHTVDKYKEAKRWLDKASEQNLSAAYYNLAGLYKDGLGVTKNLEHAVTLYKRGAQLGDVKSCGKLGFLYLHGQGVTEDISYSYLYFTLAAENGDQISSNMLNVISKQMTPQQLKQANELVKNYKFASTD
tara:strand:+ start:10532 stop:11119 length:588 start_codon:yes stop_codon:yes gene_type:complete